MTRVLFYNDAAGYGGHEIMMLLIVRELAALTGEVHLVCSGLNRQLIDEASRIESLTLHILPFTLNRFNFLTNPFNVGKIAYLGRLLRRVDPHAIVAAQGNIEISSLILLAAKRQRRKVITYIALAQTMRELGAPHAFLRAMADRYYFSLPDRFITICESQKRHLLAHGVPADRIGIVPNTVRLDPTRPCDRDEARTQLGLDPNRRYFGLLGRVVANHKGHDYLVEAARRHRDRFKGITFLVVGSGPDLEGLRKRVLEEALTDFFEFLPWTNGMDAVYAALDGVVMPSNHEGVPLVMIEAGLFGLPVIASAIDGMSDYLPAEWLFEKGNIDQMTARILTAAHSDQTPLCTAVKTKFRKIFLRPTIGHEFLAELNRMTGCGHPHDAPDAVGTVWTGDNPCQ
jgi:glycosyltransferase involved in cell wall biosynthesis